MSAPALDLVQALADEMQRRNSRRPRNNRIYASELGLALGPEFDGCQLAWYIEMKNPDVEKKDETPGSLLMMQNGELLHDYLGTIMADAVAPFGWEVEAIEKRTQLEHNDVEIGSRLDIKLRHKETGYTRVVDIKTKRGNAFKFLDKPKEGNVLQVQAYVKAENADDGSLLYVDREGQNFMKEFVVDRDDRRPEKAIEILDEIRNSDTPPPPLTYTIRRAENKGPDSVYLNTPWQINWCRLKECACKEAMGGTPPDGIVAKIKEKGGQSFVTFTPAGRRWSDVVMQLLREQYPEELFVLEG